jgi:hypothetical protein
VQLYGEREEDVALVPTLEPFRVPLASADIEIRVQWVPSIPHHRGLKAFESGTTWGVSRFGPEYAFDFFAPTYSADPFKRLLIDTRFESAVLQMSEQHFANIPLAPEPLGYPLDELLIMHRLTQERAIELHSCGIVRGQGRGNLFVGHSGAGKSTTTRLWTEFETVEVLSDDRIIVREHDGEMFMYGTPWHGEAKFASPNRAPLQRIFILQHGHGNVLTRLSASQGVAELFARSFVPFHRHEYIDSALDFLQSLVAVTPCYLYEFEPSPTAVERIANFRD